MDGNPRARLGVDIGRVIIAGPDDGAGVDAPGADTAFFGESEEEAMATPAVGLTHFVDGRVDVHVALEGIVTHRYLFGPGPAPVGVEITPTWAAVEAAIARPGVAHRG